MAESVEGQEPAFISYLMDPDLKHDCYFLVGDEKLTTPVRFGAVKKMLLAHSVVLRTELQDSELAEKGIVHIKDIYPDTFRHLLKFVYGYDTTASLSFDDANNMLYAAEKYLITPLKNRLAVHLMKLLTYENICSLMNNPACFRQLELNSEITKMLQNETDKILASPQFLSLSPDAFLRILQQDTMNLPEIDVWKAALKWAKHRTDSEDGDKLRKELTPHVKHIRFCTLSSEDLVNEVVNQNVLNSHEFMLVCQSVCLEEQQIQLTEICNTIVSRTVNPIVSRMVNPSDTIVTTLSVEDYGYKSQCTFKILTKKSSIELLPFVFKARHPPSSVMPEGVTYQCECTVEITRITDYTNDTSTETPVTIRFQEQVQFGEGEFQVPITLNGQNFRLLANKKFIVKLTLNQDHLVYFNSSSSIHNHEHFTIQLINSGNSRSYCFLIPISKLFYKISE